MAQVTHLGFSLLILLFQLYKILPITVTINSQTAELPASSVAVYVTVSCPDWNKSPG